MNIAICMTECENLHDLSECIDHYQNSHAEMVLCSYYHNTLDFFACFIPGRYDAIFFDRLLTPSDLGEIKHIDRQIRLISLVSAGHTNTPQVEGMWSLLPTPPEPQFVCSVLERLRDETTTQGLSSIALKTKSSVIRLPFTSIEYVEVLGRTIIFHLTDGGKEEVVGTFSTYVDRLLELPDFVKTHRSYLVNLRYVQKLAKEGILTSSGAVVPVSESIYPKFKRDYMESLMLLPQVEPEESNALPPSPNAPHILLVDDDPTELIRWGDILRKKGCTVVTAENEKIALYLLGKERYACVILDVQLGSGSGFDLHQRMGHLTHAPILYLSTLSDFENQTRGFQVGGVDYITKDVSGELFWLKVQSRIQASTSPHMTVSVGQFLLHTGQCTATLNEIPLPLTVVEFNLLHLFVQNPDTTFSPAELYRRIWGKDTWDNGHTTQLHLSTLSEKLNQVSPGHRYIEAVWGKGYRFLPDGRGGAL